MTLKISILIETIYRKTDLPTSVDFGLRQTTRRSPFAKRVSNKQMRPPSYQGPVFRGFSILRSRRILFDHEKSLILRLASRPRDSPCLVQLKQER